MSDGPYGVRSNLKFPSTVYPAGVGLAASLDRDLAERIGQGIGKDARARGIHFMLGAGVNGLCGNRNARKVRIGENLNLHPRLSTLRRGHKISRTGEVGDRLQC